MFNFGNLFPTKLKIKLEKVETFNYTKLNQKAVCVSTTQKEKRMYLLDQ